MNNHNVMEVASSAMRGCIVAAPGRKLVVADLSNIEGRTQAWLAREQWKLQAFRDFDTIGADGQRKGHDLYKLAYAKAFGIKPEDVTKDQRQKGKVMELALGYQGGVGAFVTFALAYGIDLEEMADDAWDALPPDLVEEAEGFLSWLHSKVHDASKARIKKIEAKHRKMRDDGMLPPAMVRIDEAHALEMERIRRNLELDNAQYGLSRKVFIVCDVFKRAWRLAHPNIAAMWKELENAAVAATTQPGRTFKVGALAFRRDGAWLRIRLPSGFFLCYPSPEVSEDGKFSYMGVDQYTRKWRRIPSYGGKIFENVNQAMGRDVMASNMPRIEQAGYEIVLSVHDELLTETPDAPEYDADGLSALLATVPEWAPGLPLAAAGFEAYRYRKD